MGLNRPHLVDYRDKLIHEMGYVFEMRRDMIADVDGLLAKPTAKLRDIGYSGSIQRPQHVLVEGLDPLFQGNLYAIRQKIILAQQILLLYTREELGIVGLPN